MQKPPTFFFLQVNYHPPPPKKKKLLINQYGMCFFYLSKYQNNDHGSRYKLLYEWIVHAHLVCVYQTV